MSAMHGPWSHASFFRSLARGFAGRCPHCGKGRMFYRYLKVSPHCPACGHDLDRYPADDGPPYFTVLIIGHLVVVPILIIFAPLIWKVSPWITIPAAVAPVLAITLLALPRVKGAVIGAHYALGVHRGDAHLHTADAAD